MAKNRINAVIRVPCTFDENFVEKWLRFLSPISKLSKPECRLGAIILNRYFKIAKNLEDYDMAWDMLFSTESRKKMIEKLGQSTASYYKILESLKEKGFINGNRINAKYMPKLEEADDSYVLAILFEKKDV